LVYSHVYNPSLNVSDNVSAFTNPHWLKLPTDPRSDRTAGSKT